MLKTIAMEKGNNNKFFSRTSVARWTPAIVSLLLIQVFFGWKDGLSGVLWSVVPMIIGLAYCVGFLWFGFLLTKHVSWLVHVLLLIFSSVALVTTTFVTLITFTAADPINQLKYFLPGETSFWVVLIFSSLLILLGILPRISGHKT